MLVFTDAVKNFTKYGVSKHGVVTGEAAIKAQLVAGGPVACGICSKKLDDYAGGVWTGVNKSCSDHTISIAGYGVAKESGVDMPYWLIRNSWGTFWGEGGWARVYRGNNTADVSTARSLLLLLILRGAVLTDEF